ncbi:hypothetical protein HNP98_000625 [Hymenobacter sp. 9A]|uniref:Uncharacterized protein n=1 Tax=Hymenobacter caeli TaxID=2735894 RepID=A0ABX2FL19_9BACT|nr:hypothetical protein [Hymenobacter caeli]NRT17818.1 hypothetical protein [Hymenobacter caeli]
MFARRSVRVVPLPLGLALAVAAGLGSYYETNDEGALAWLFGGVAAAGPVPAVALYFHGYGHALAAAYAAAPAGPWLGLLLAALLALATVGAFDVLDALLGPWLRPGPRAGALAVFFGAGWLEHWLWFSHVRVAALLAGAALLWAARRPGRRGPLLLGLAALLAAWLLRPGVAALGAAAAVPGVLLLAGGWRRAAPLLLGAGLLLAGATALETLGQSAAGARTRAYDTLLAQVLDYEQLQPAPRTAADRLGVAATRLWLLGDSTATNPALYRRAYRFEAATFFGRTVPAKLAERLPLLARDYFPLLLALAASWALARRRGPARGRGFWGVQAAFAGALLLLAGALKLPPRLALPLLDFWLLNNLIFLLASPSEPPVLGLPGGGLPGPRYALGVVVALVLAAYAAKTAHRCLVLGLERARHERTLAELARRTAGRPRVLAGTTELLKSLSPFRSYALGPGAVLGLSGWPAHDASQPALRRALTGAPGQAEALRRLARRPPPGAAWVLAAPEAAWLNAAARRGPPGQRWALRPGPALATDSSLRFYRPGPSF